MEYSWKVHGMSMKCKHLISKILALEFPVKYNGNNFNDCSFKIIICAMDLINTKIYIS